MEQIFKKQLSIAITSLYCSAIIEIVAPNKTGNIEKRLASLIMQNEQKRRTKTLQKIADLTGFSKATVSRALSGSDAVSAQTKERVFKAAYEQDEPKATASKSILGTVALIVPGADTPSSERLNHPFYLELSTAIIAELSKLGYASIIEQIPLWSEQSIEHFFNKYNCVGCIMIGQPAEQDFRNIEYFKKRAKHLISWGANASELDLITVGSENTNSARDAVSHLIKNGRQNIMFLGDRAYRETRQRYDGYVMAHLENKLQYNDKLVVDVPSFDMQRSSQLLIQTINQHKNVDAVFATSDLLIMKAVTTLLELGLSVPDDIAMIGFDDIKLASYFNPPITTVKQNVSLGARLLVEKLIRSIKGQTITSELLSSELVIRKSCGALQ